MNILEYILFGEDIDVNDNSGPARREAIAYHEAAHAVVAWAHGHEVREVRIKATGGATEIKYGEYVPEDPKGLATPDELANAQAVFNLMIRIRVSLAGALAERRFTGRWNLEAAHVDLVEAYVRAREIQALTGRSWESRIQTERDITERFYLDVHWPLIEALAALLIKKGRARRRDLEWILSRQPGAALSQMRSSPAA